MSLITKSLTSPLRSPWTGRALAAAGLCAVAEALVLLAISPMARADPIVLLATALMLVATFLPPACLLAAALFVVERWTRRLPVPPVSVNVAGVAALTVAVIALRLLLYAESKLNLEFPGPVALAMTFAIVVILVVAAALGFLVERLLRMRAHALEAQISPRRLLALEGLAGVFLATWVAQSGAAAANDNRLLPFAGPAVLLLALMVVRGLEREGRAPRARLNVLLLVGALVSGGLAGALRDDARFLLSARAATSSSFLLLGRALSDLDDDGAGSALWGGTDCAPQDARSEAARREIPGNGIDDDCRGGDAVAAPPSAADIPRTGPWATCLQQSAGAPRSVILITIDTLRVDVLSPERTPALAALARRSAWFTRAYPQSTSTLLSLYGLLGSRHISDAPNGTFANAVQPPPPGGFPAALGDAGVPRLAIPMLFLPSSLQGAFDVVTLGRRDPDEKGAKFAFTSSTVTDTALELLATQQEPFFLWAHYLDPHAPFLPISRELLPEPEGTDYEREVAYTMLQVGRLLDGLAASPHADDTIVVVTADHGEGLGERGRHGHGPDLFEPSVHVPLAFYVPGCPSVLVDEPVSHADIVPALALLTGVKVPRPFSLLDAVAGRPRPLPVVVETGFQGELSRAVIEERYKLIVDVRGGGKLLFDLERDPGETRSLYGRDDDVTRRMEALYQRWLDRPPLPGDPTPSPEGS